ncbi:hypothetical protein [Thomasclavelia sp.]
MKKQILKLSIIYLILMILGLLWCYPYINFKTDIKDLFIYTLIWSSASYGLWSVLFILDKFKILAFLMKKIKFIMIYIPYVYMCIFLVESIIGLVMVFIFKEYYFAYAFFPVLTIIHATILSNQIISHYNTY